MSMPLPSVALMIWEAKAVDLEENIRSGGMPKVVVRKFRFSSVPTVAKICISSVRRDIKSSG